MRYQKATEILPEDLVELIQNYVDGEYVYIPRKQENKKNWGEGTSFKEEIRCRNMEVYRKYQEGLGIRELAEEYYLSEKSIQRILTSEKQKNKDAE